MKNQKDEAPLAIYTARYAEIDPQTVTARCGAAFDGGGFTLTLMGYPIYAAWPEFSIKTAEGAPAALSSAAVKILVLRYLTEGVAAPATGRFLVYRELPWGAVYDANFQGRCSRRLAFTFGTKPELFRRACQALGARPLELPDVSYELPFFDGLAIRLVLRDGDEEFPPTSQFMFSDNFVTALSAEDVAVVGEVVIKVLKELSQAL